MLADFELNEINRLNQIFDRLVQANQQECARMASLLQMLHAVCVDAWLDEAGEITVVNQILEALYPIGLGAGYMGLGADGT